MPAIRPPASSVQTMNLSLYNDAIPSLMELRRRAGETSDADPWVRAS
jgi:hypothetical protein